jgi:hypothetical protein
MITVVLGLQQQLSSHWFRWPTKNRLVVTSPQKALNLDSKMLSLL